MKIQLLSDLHLEFFKPSTKKNYTISKDADVIAMVGDINLGVAALIECEEVAEISGKPVIFVPGNHEFYHGDIRELSKVYRKGAKGVHVLLGNNYPDIKKEEMCVEIDGVRFLGGTLWTDFRLYEGSMSMPSQNEALQLVGQSLNDFKIIKRGDNLFTAKDSLKAHEEALKVIKKVLDTPFNGKNVLITHHGVHKNSIHKKYLPPVHALETKAKIPGDNGYWRINSGFVSHLPELVAKIDLCLHGHIHNSMDYMVGNTRIVANPRGYPINGGTAWENPDYESEKLIEI